MTTDPYTLSLHYALPIFINHAEDKVIFVDEDILPLVDKLQDHLTTVKAYVVMTDKDELPANTLPNVYSYEQLLENGVYIGQSVRSEEHTSELQSRFDIVC